MAWEASVLQRTDLYCQRTSVLSGQKWFHSDQLSWHSLSKAGTAAAITTSSPSNATVARKETSCPCHHLLTGLGARWWASCRVTVFSSVPFPFSIILFPLLTHYLGSMTFLFLFLIQLWPSLLYLGCKWSTRDDSSECILLSITVWGTIKKISPSFSLIYWKLWYSVP